MLITVSPVYTQHQYDAEQTDYYPVPKTLILKIKQDKLEFYKDYLNTRAFNDEFLPVLGEINFRPVFPYHKPLQPTDKIKNTNLVDLSLIYSMHFQKDFPLDALIFRLNRTGLFEYIQAAYPVSPLFVPNDQKLGDQYYLSKIFAYQAWDICQGDTNTIIGIVDSGTDLDHPDLIGNIKYNYNDPIDGQDNDNDGFIDNFQGWDMGDMDNNPQVIPGGSNVSHGVHMCGIASASTNNTTGVAGVGFKCKFLPVKINNVANQYIAGYEGIVYAADQGCKVINCSWGGQQTAGRFGQDIINYATFNKDALVVAACGNSNSDIPFYPASYENVLSIGATGGSDERMFINNGYASSYGYYVDVCAPGAGIFNTWDYPYFYNTLSGTSMAAAVTSGAAALIRSYYPGFTAIQTAEKLRVTADRIDTLPANMPYFERLGSGRINLYKALTDTLSPSVRIIGPNFTDGNDSVFRPGDTVKLIAEFHNYLAEVNNMKISITSLVPGIVMLDSSFTIPVFAASTSVINQSNPFRFKLLPQLSSDAVLMFRIGYDAGTFHSFEFVRLDLNGDYLNIKAQNIKTTITSKGKIGFNDNWNLQGIGFSYKNDINRLYSGGFSIGTSYFNVSDALYNSTFSGWDNDFKPVQKVQEVIPSAFADHEYLTVYNDDYAGSSALGLTITQRTYSWNQEEDSRFIIHELCLKNTGSNTLANLYAGLFADWDINMEATGYDHVSWDNNYRLGITSSLISGPFAGISLLTNDPVKHYAFDNDGSNGSIKITDGFTALEKYTSLKSNRSQAGQSASGNNVSDQVSSGPFLLLPGDSVIVAFAMMAAEQLTDLRNAAQRASDRYFHVQGTNDITKGGFNGIDIFPNPATSSARIRFFADEPAKAVLIVTDVAGRINQVSNSMCSYGYNTFDLNIDGLTSGTYFLEIIIKNKMSWTRFIKM